MSSLQMNTSLSSRGGLTRRDALSALLAVSAASALAACKKPTSEGGTAEVSNAYAAGDKFFSATEMAQIAALAQAIVPQTDTAGAVEAGVPEVIQGLASEWGDDDYRRYMRGGLNGLVEMIRKDAGQDVGEMAPKMRDNTLARFDAKVFERANRPDDVERYTDAVGDNPEPKSPGTLSMEVERERDNFYREFKRLVVTAYYMSEPGATEELAYEAVPGEWIGCAPLEDYPKTWAT